MPAGNYVARCFQIIDLGTQVEVYNGDTKEQHKIRISWETPTETKVFKEELGEQPYIVSQEYTLSLGDKANLRKMLVSWRGKDFTEEELQGFDILKLLGKPCMIQVIHKTSKSGNQYITIGSVANLPKGIECPEQINPSVSLSFENWSDEIFNTLNDFIKDKIKDSKEYQQRTNPNEHTVSDEGTPF
jgi:hypothetical protein